MGQGMCVFKNAMIYQIGEHWSATAADAEQALQSLRFVPCTATQEKSVGFVPPRGDEHGLLLESVGGQWIAMLQIELRAVPANVVRREAEVRIAALEAESGRKPGKKQRRDILDDVRMALLPQAFSREIRVPLWIDPAERRLLVDAASQSRSDEAVSALIKALPGLSVSLLHTAITPQSAMTQWLLAESSDEWPGALAVERDGVLKALGEEPACIRYTRHSLMSEDVREHVRHGRLPVQLAMSWDGVVSFVLTETMQLKRLRFLDGTDEADREDRFDADVALATGTLTPLIEGLIEALGGRLMAADQAAQ